MSNHPPKPRLTVTIGVTGHRLHRNPPPAGGDAAKARAFDVEAVEKSLGALFQLASAACAKVADVVSASYEAAPPVLTLISSLAEGADRLAARAAIDAGFALDVVLPCPATIYGATFADDASRADFDALLKSARACLALPLAGRSDEAVVDRLPRSYEAAGLTMLAQSDILAAVWDGEPANGRGGTGEIVDEAVRRGVPVVVIDPANGATRVLLSDDAAQFGFARHAEDVVPRALETSLPLLIERLAAPPPSPRERRSLAAYLASRRSGAAVGDDASRASLVYDGKDVERSRSRWPRLAAAVAARPSNRHAVKRYSEALLAAEDVAGRSASRYRRLFLLSFAASAFASLCVAAAAGFHGQRVMHEAASVIEFVTVGLVGGLVFVATRQSWHSQWFEAREVVERLRIVSASWLLGAWPTSLGPGQAAWPGWYARAITREQPLFSGDLAELLGEAREMLRALIDEQSAYHTRNAARLDRRDRFLEIVGPALLLSALGANAFYLAAAFAHSKIMGPFEPWGLAASIFLPAAATASYGVRLFGDFEDLARRSRRTARRLEALKPRLAGEPDLAELRTLAGQAASAMLADLEAWRVAVESRRLSAT